MSENERVTYDDKGRLDEIVGAGVTHLERMNTSDWFLEIGNADGTSTALWFKSKNLPTLLEKRDAPQRMTGTPSKDRAEAHMETGHNLSYGAVGLSRAIEFDTLAIMIAIELAKAHAEGRKAGFAEGMKRAAEIAHGVGNFGDYKREELTEDYGQPRFDLMHEIVASILAAAKGER